MKRISPLATAAAVQRDRIGTGGSTGINLRMNIKEMGFDIENPAYSAVGDIVSGATNVPLDRVVNNINNIGIIYICE